MDKPHYDKQPYDLTEQRFGKLVAKMYAYAGASGAHWLCDCDCGNWTISAACQLKCGKTKSCGCITLERLSKHGLSDSSPIYRVWSGMRSRCRSPKNVAYHNYGGRGIKVCDEWNSFEIFQRDMIADYRSGLTLDRRDNSGDYCKENCRWVSRAVQNSNQRRNRFIDTPAGRITVSQAAKIFQIHINTLNKRIASEWPENTLLIPVDKRLSRSGIKRRPSKKHSPARLRS